MLDLLVQVLYHLRTHVVRHSAVIHRDQNRHLLPVTPNRHRPRPQLLRDSLRLRLPHRVPAQPNRIIRRDVNLRDADLPQRFLLRSARPASAHETEHENEAIAGGRRGEADFLCTAIAQVLRSLRRNFRCRFPHLTRLTLLTYLTFGCGFAALRSSRLCGLSRRWCAAWFRPNERGTTISQSNGRVKNRPGSPWCR